jgi:hypothetical protein
MYQTIPSIKEKDEFVVEITKSVFDPNFTTQGTENIQKFVHDLVGFYVIMEGIFFYAGFAMMLSMLRKNRMVGVGEQFQFILRDESVHLAFGADLINTIVQENPQIWTPSLSKHSPTTSKKASSSRKKYADDALPRGVLASPLHQSSNMLSMSPTAALSALGSSGSIMSTTRSLGCLRSPTCQKRKTSSKPALPNTKPENWIGTEGTKVYIPGLPAPYDIIYTADDTGKAFKAYNGPWVNFSGGEGKAACDAVAHLDRVQTVCIWIGKGLPEGECMPEE